MKNILFVFLLIIATPAYAYSPAGSVAGAVAGSVVQGAVVEEETAAYTDYLAGVVDGVCAQYSGLDSASADGTGETFKNLIEQPASGCGTQAGWDLNDIAIGATEPDWSAAKSRWVANHSGAFQFTNQSGPTALLNSHRNTSGNPITIVYYGFHPGADTGGIVGGPDTSSALHGLGISWFNTDYINITDGSATATCGSGFELFESHFFIITIDPTQTTNNVKCWVNSRTAETKSMTFSSDATWDAGVWVWAYDNEAGSPTGTVNQDQEMQELAFINRFISQSEAEAIIDYYKAYTGEPIALDDAGDITDTSLLVFNMHYTGGTNFFLRDIAIRDSLGNDLITGLTDLGAVDLNITTINALDAGEYGAAADEAQTDRVRLWNDAAWDDGGTPQSNSTVRSYDSGTDLNIRVMARFSTPQNLGSLGFYLNNPASFGFPDTYEIYTQDGIISYTSAPNDYTEYDYDNPGNNDYGYKITLQ